MNRRIFLAAIPGFLAACTTNYKPGGGLLSGITADPYYQKMYAAVTDEKFPIPAVDISKVDPKFLRREVDYDTAYAPGNIVINTTEHFAYFILPEGKAMRYGVGVARNQAGNFRGRGVIARKAEWPSWAPTLNMMRTQPERYGHLGDGLPPGPTNPLGARALYLYKDGKDTYFRIHGTIEPWTIGTDVSSGCIRLFNQDIIDLYNRVSVGAEVIVTN